MLEQFQDIIDKFDIKVSAERLKEENEKLHQKNSSKVTIFDGIESMFNHFKKRGKIISFCSNRGIGSLKMILEKNGLSKYTDNLISCSEEGHDKPDPFCLTKLLEKYPDISKSESIYFGDSKTDAEFATAAGIDYLIIDHYLNKKVFYQLILELFADSKNESVIEK